jgi:methyl-accepting chemotaxis protein
VDGLVDEIAAASQEQAQGIEQVNKAVGEMDKVTQQTAAIAEESSGASEEMNGRAEELKQFVAQLIGIVRGGANQASRRNDSKVQQMQNAEAEENKASSPRASVRVKEKGSVLSKLKDTRPERLIPFEKKDFEEF